MKVVIDANIVISALLRDGTVRRTLATTDAQLFAPALLRHELGKHLGAIARRAGVKKADAKASLEGLLADVVWIGDEVLMQHWERAHRELGRRDPQDVAYLACALAIKADAIWSFDPDFDIQKLVRRVSNPNEPSS